MQEAIAKKKKSTKNPQPNPNQNPFAIPVLPNKWSEFRKGR